MASVNNATHAGTGTGAGTGGGAGTGTGAGTGVETSAGTGAGISAGTGGASEPNEHDYAHNDDFTAAADGGVPAPERAVELPEPAVGAEVDCPGGPGGPGGDDADGTGGTDDPARPGAAPAATSRRGRRGPKRPEDRNCCCCRLEFERTGRSFNRRAVFTFTSPDTVRWAFPGAAAAAAANKRSFLCEACAQVIRSKCKRRSAGKRSMWLKPAVSVTKPDVRDKKKKGRRMGKKSKAAQLVSKSCYKAALKMLWSAKGARKPMMDFWSKQLKEEMKALSRQPDNPFHEKVSNKKPLTSFPWGRCLNWAQEKAPLVTACLRSLFPDINALTKSSHQLSEEQAQMLLERRAVVTLSIPLFTRNIWKNNFLQAALGAELRLQGCSGSALDALNTMGLCQNKDTVRLLLHRLRSGKKPAENGRRMKMKQDPMEGEQMSDVEEEDDEEEEEEEEVVEEDDEDDDEEEEEDEEEDDEEEEEEEEPAVEEKAELEEKRRKRAAKKQRKEEKRKERGKRKAKDQEEEEEEEEDEGSEPKKKRVVVVRLDLLKGHSEVGRSDLSAP